MEEGSINESSCFLVEISRKDQLALDYVFSQSNFVSDIISAKVSSSRINLADEDLFSGLDFGNDIDSGEKYRTKILIDPDYLLKPNTNYAAILSKDISAITVFDAESGVGNTGIGLVKLKGKYTGLISDEYTVTVTSSGTKSSAEYMWSRLSDGHTQGPTEAKGKFVLLDQGVSIKFLDGDFVIGDSFTIKVIPADNQSEIYSWTFSSGSGEFQEPEDKRSDTVIGLPVQGSPTTALEENLQVVSVSPLDSETLVAIAKRASVSANGILFRTKEYTSDYNGYTIEFISGAIAGSETVNISSNQIEIAIEDGVSTAQQVLDAFNAHALGADIEASSSNPSQIQILSDPKSLSGGVNQNSIEIIFNKDLDVSSITDDKIKILSRAIYPIGSEKVLSFDKQVSGKQLLITLKED